PGTVYVLRLAVVQVLAGVVRVDPADALDERGLASAVVPDECGDLAGLDDEVHVPQDVDRAEALVHAAQFQQGCGHGLLRLDDPVPVPRWRYRDRLGRASADPGRRALGRVRPGAQLVLGHILVGDDILDVVLVDRHRRLQHRLDVLAAVRVLHRL